jgi:hypothetical protein
MAPPAVATPPLPPWAVPGGATGGGGGGGGGDAVSSEVERWLSTPEANGVLERPDVGADYGAPDCLLGGLDPAAADDVGSKGEAGAGGGGVGPVIPGGGPPPQPLFLSFDHLMDVNNESMAFHDEECYDAMSSVPDTVQSLEDDAHDLHHEHDRDNDRPHAHADDHDHGDDLAHDRHTGLGMIGGDHLHDPLQASPVAHTLTPTFSLPLPLPQQHLPSPSVDDDGAAAAFEPGHAPGAAAAATAVAAAHGPAHLDLGAPHALPLQPAAGTPAKAAARRTPAVTTPRSARSEPAARHTKGKTAAKKRQNAGHRSGGASSAPALGNGAVSCGAGGGGKPDASLSASTSITSPVAAAAAAAAASIAAAATLRHRVAGREGDGASGAAVRAKAKAAKPRKRKRTAAGDGSGAAGKRSGGTGGELKGRTKGDGQAARKRAAVSAAASASTSDDDRNVPVRERCMKCGTGAKNTPMMRKGPDGCRSMCNACGLRWARHGIC